MIQQWFNDFDSLPPRLDTRRHTMQEHAALGIDQCRAIHTGEARFE
jgi:hypothetical protein